MRLWISYEEDFQVLSKVQAGFPELFTEEQEKEKVGPFPLSYIRKVFRLYKGKREHEDNCDWDEGEVCKVCEYYQNIPDIHIPFISIRSEDVSQELISQIKSHTGDEIPCETYFPYKLYDIVYEGQTFYLGRVDMFKISLCIKGAIYVDE